MSARTKGASRRDWSPLAWPAAVAFATLAGTLATSCMMPLVALAASISATMPGRRGASTLFAAWAGNQLLGFWLLNYPATAYTFAWGGALLGAAGIAWLVAGAVVGGRGELVASRLAAGFVAAFLAYEAVLCGFASIVGGLETFTPGIVARIALNETIWFASLLALRVILTSGAPTWFGAPVRLRLLG